MTTQIGAQMFTLRDHCKTPSDIAKTCEKLKAAVALPFRLS